MVLACGRSWEERSAAAGKAWKYRGRHKPGPGLSWRVCEAQCTCDGDGELWEEALGRWRSNQVRNEEGRRKAHHLPDARRSDARPGERGELRRGEQVDSTASAARRGSWRLSRGRGGWRRGQWLYCAPPPRCLAFTHSSFFHPSLSLEFTEDASDRKFDHVGWGPSAYLRIDLLPNKLTTGPKDFTGPIC
jgi:hypothetical protein